MEQYNTNFNNLLLSYNLDPNTMCDVLRRTGGVIAGSFPLQAIIDEDWKESDIDIWVENKSDDMDISPISKFWRILSPLGYRISKKLEQSKNDISSSGYRRLEYCVESIYTFSGDNLKKIQVIQLHPFDSWRINNFFNTEIPITMERFLGSFDIKICGVYFGFNENNETCTLNVTNFNCDMSNNEVISDINDRILNINYSVLSPPNAVFPEWIRTLKRLIKYNTRGFTINWNDRVKETFNYCVTEFFNDIEYINDTIIDIVGRWNKKIVRAIGSIENIDNSSLSELPLFGDSEEDNDMIIYRSERGEEWFNIFRRHIDLLNQERQEDENQIRRREIMTRRNLELERMRQAWREEEDDNSEDENSEDEEKKEYIPPLDQESIQNIIDRNQEMIDEQSRNRRAAWRRICAKLRSGEIKEDENVYNKVLNIRDSMKDILNFLNLEFTESGGRRPSWEDLCYDMSEMVSVYNNWKNNIIPKCSNEETSIGDELKDLGFGDLWIVPINNDEYNCFSTEEIVNSTDGLNFYNRQPINSRILNFVRSIKDFVQLYYGTIEANILTLEQKERVIIHELHNVSYDINLDTSLRDHLLSLQLFELVNRLQESPLIDIDREEYYNKYYAHIGNDMDVIGEYRNAMVDDLIEDLYKNVNINDDNKQTRLLSIIYDLGVNE